MHPEEQDAISLFSNTVIIIILKDNPLGEPIALPAKMTSCHPLKYVTICGCVYPAFDMEWCSISTQFNYMLLLYIVDGSLAELFCLVENWP